ncbi:hypothetical protein EQW76_00715 [Rhizobium sp. rho-13.1]|uniref:hypothetical protein n=1 Tax=Rhizobium sp. rho-13.1 TaxID=2506431 RepID=UPI00115D202C|nr:hypothetical protein [Rhizobium sp. rho-13.1]TQX91294.1 hypothetical protein EQW76_00715 [Rhizobium sp. rho-13.1]
MKLMKGSEPSFMTAEEAANRRGYASLSELALRDGLEGILRQRLPDARIVHELVMGAREVRADVVAISPGHIAAVEVKGAYDNVSRLLHQVGMFQLCVPEVWVCCAKEHAEDARLIRHLLPSVGLIVGSNLDRHYHRGDKVQPLDLQIEAEPVPRPVVPQMMLEMLWAEELRASCHMLKISVTSATTRPKAIACLLEFATPQELMAVTCAQLRARDAIWRADNPIAVERAGA